MCEIFTVALNVNHISLCEVYKYVIIHIYLFREREAQGDDRGL